MRLREGNQLAPNCPPVKGWGQDSHSGVSGSKAFFWAVSLHGSGSLSTLPSAPTHPFLIPLLLEPWWLCWVSRLWLSLRPGSWAPLRTLGTSWIRYTGGAVDLLVSQYVCLLPVRKSSPLSCKKRGRTRLAWGKWRGGGGRGSKPWSGRAETCLVFGSQNQFPSQRSTDTWKQELTVQGWVINTTIPRASLGLLWTCGTYS